MSAKSLKNSLEGTLSLKNLQKGAGRKCANRRYNVKKTVQKNMQHCAKKGVNKNCKNFTRASTIFCIYEKDNKPEGGKNSYHTYPMLKCVYFCDIPTTTK